MWIPRKCLMKQFKHIPGTGISPPTFFKNLKIHQHVRQDYSLPNLFCATPFVTATCTYPKTGIFFQQESPYYSLFVLLQAQPTPTQSRTISKTRNSWANKLLKVVLKIRNRHEYFQLDYKLSEKRKRRLVKST